MFRFKMNILIKFLFCFILVYSFISLDAVAQQMTKISGKMTLDNIERQAYESGYTEGHSISLTKSEGINVSTHSNAFMDKAQVVNFSFADLINGNGPYQGYIKLMKNDDVVYCKWQGNIKTVMGDGGVPIISFEGTFSYVNGSGLFKNIQGKGTFHGNFISKTTHLVEWEGEYSVQ